MRMYVLHFIVFVGLAGCTSQHVEINIHRNGEVDQTTSPTTKQSLVPVDDFTPQFQEAARKTEKPTGWCPRFTPPTLSPTPSIPKDIQSKKEMTDAELIAVLTEYARELRKASLENQNAVNAAYKRYVDSCKK